MNTCILMADIIQDPQIRYTPDNQTPIAEMVVQFPGIRPEDPPATLKVIGWGNLAQEIQANYHVGDRVVIEGRLAMNTIDRPEGFKEKRAELTAQRLHRVGAGSLSDSATPLSAPIPAKEEKTPTRSSAAPTRTASSPKAKTPTSTFAPSPSMADTSLDDIPF